MNIAYLINIKLKVIIFVNNQVLQLKYYFKCSVNTKHTYGRPTISRPDDNFYLFPNCND